MEAEALKAFFSHIDSLNILPCYWPNVKSEKPTDSHLRVSVTPVSPNVLTVCDGAEQNLWLLQISVYVRDGVGEIIPSQYADALKNGIPFNTKLQSGGYEFQTLKRGEIKPLIASGESGWVFKPVQFRFSSIN